MGKISKELINQLTEFLVSEIGSKSLDGITYAIFTKDTRDKESVERYMKIREESIKCGYDKDELFRVYEINNGYIMDMDIGVAKKITFELSKAVAKANNNSTPVGDIIGENPNKRRMEDMVRLGKYAKQQFEEGNNILDVALFSRNSVPRIIINAIGPNGENLPIKYNGYSIRHWDLESLNKNILIKQGLRIAKIETIEVLPSKTGVRFKLYTEAV